MAPQTKNKGGGGGGELGEREKKRTLDRRREILNKIRAGGVGGGEGKEKRGKGWCVEIKVEREHNKLRHKHTTERGSVSRLTSVKRSKID